MMTKTNTKTKTKTTTKTKTKTRTKISYPSQNPTDKGLTKIQKMRFRTPGTMGM